MFRSYLGQQGSLADLESTPLMEFEVKNIANFFFFYKKAINHNSALQSS